MKPEYRVRFEPSGRTVYVLPGTTLFEAAARAGLVLQSPCGGRGTCGKCRVRVVEGDCPATEVCTRALGAEPVAGGARLACQARVFNDCVVSVPRASLFESRTRILTEGQEQAVAVDPAISKRFVELPEPTNEDEAADLRRLERALDRPVHVHLDVLRRLPGNLRRSNFRGTAVLCDDRLVDFEPGDTTDEAFGVAFDLGTTTVVAVLMDCVQGRDRGVAAEMNPQVAFGDDVISRIMQVREDPAALGRLQAEVVRTMNDLIGRLCAGAGVSRERIYEVTVAGNTTMQHLFCGISPAALGEVPFPPAFHRGLMLSARETGLAIHPNGRLYVFPNIGGFVGGDTVAGILAAGLQRRNRPTLFVDIGTNGEIVLAHDGRLLATSTAAGPAFEGARITAGMRATDGAIEKVLLNEHDIVFNVIGNTQPAGICGTALIDLTAVLLRAGVIDSTGRILGADEAPAALPGKIKARLRETDGHVDFLLVPAQESGTGEAIYLYQKDIRELQLASGAIRAGVLILLRKAGIAPEDLDAVLLAGGFGNFIRRKNARRIGLLPPVPTERIRFVGNASSMGAKAALLNRVARREAEAIAESAEHVDLSLDPEFQMEFGMAMLFPEEDID